MAKSGAWRTRPVYIHARCVRILSCKNAPIDFALLVIDVTQFNHLCIQRTAWSAYMRRLNLGASTPVARNHNRGSLSPRKKALGPFFLQGESRLFQLPAKSVISATMGGGGLCFCSFANFFLLTGTCLRLVMAGPSSILRGLNGYNERHTFVVADIARSQQEDLLFLAHAYT